MLCPTTPTKRAIVLLDAQAEAGLGVEETCRKLGISHATFFRWKAEYGDLGTPELRRLRQLEEENQKLKQLVADLPRSFCEHTGSRSFLDHPEAGPGRRPSRILGWMFLKALRDEAPATGDGRPYDARELNYFWARLARRADALPAGLRAAALARRPSAALRRGVVGLVGRAPVFTATGRLRAGATFAARQNNIFQDLDFDGAKLALWLVWRAGFTILNFVHDEIVVELPEGPNAPAEARRVAALMVNGMRQVVPDVRVAVEYALATSWAKADRLGAAAVVTSDARDLADLATEAPSTRPGRCGSPPCASSPPAWTRRGGSPAWAAAGSSPRRMRVVRERRAPSAIKFGVPGRILWRTPPTLGAAWPAGGDVCASPRPAASLAARGRPGGCPSRPRHPAWSADYRLGGRPAGAGARPGARRFWGSADRLPVATEERPPAHFRRPLRGFGAERRDRSRRRAGLASATGLPSGALGVTRSGPADVKEAPHLRGLRARVRHAVRPTAAARG